MGNSNSPHEWYVGKSFRWLRPCVARLRFLPYMAVFTAMVASRRQASVSFATYIQAFQYGGNIRVGTDARLHSSSSSLCEIPPTRACYFLFSRVMRILSVRAQYLTLSCLPDLHILRQNMVCHEPVQQSVSVDVTLLARSSTQESDEVDYIFLGFL